MGSPAVCACVVVGVGVGVGGEIVEGVRVGASLQRRRSGLAAYASLGLASQRGWSEASSGSSRRRLGAVSSSNLATNGTAAQCSAACWKNLYCLNVGMPRPRFV